jgi:hypothetical protein
LGIVKVLKEREFSGIIQTKKESLHVSWIRLKKIMFLSSVV